MSKNYIRLLLATPNDTKWVSLDRIMTTAQLKAIILKMKPDDANAFLKEWRRKC